jgi:hypothetical protein
MEKDYYTLNLDYDLVYRLHVDHLHKGDILRGEFQRFASVFGPLGQKKGAIWGGGFGGHIAYAHLKERCDRMVLIDRDPPSAASDFTRIPVVSPQAYLEAKTPCDFILIATHPRHYPEIVETIRQAQDHATAICLLYNNPLFYATKFVEKRRVILSTLPKSGTSWLNLMLKDLLLENRGYRFKEDRRMADMQYEMYFTNHMPVAEAAPYVDNQENRFIFLYRDLRDHLVSWVHHYKHRRDNIDHKLSRYMAGLDFEEALIEFIVGEPNTKGYGTAAVTPLKRTCAMVNEWLDLAAQHRNVTTVTYEDLHRDCYDTLRRILGFVGIQVEEEVLSRVVERRSFKRMTHGRNPGEEDKGNHWRKGVVGDWKNYFTPLAKDLFKKMAGDFLVKTGYEEDSGW